MKNKCKDVTKDSSVLNFYDTSPHVLLVYTVELKLAHLTSTDYYSVISGSFSITVMVVC